LRSFHVIRSRYPGSRAGLGCDWPVRITADWDRLVGAVPRAKCSLLLVPQLRSLNLQCGLSNLKASHPHHPVVLVTLWDLDNARYLKNLYVDEVIWYHEIEQSLRNTIERVCARNPNYVRSLYHLLQKAETLPERLRDALAHVCLPERPTHSVNQLAIAVGSNRATLWNQWRRVLGFSSPLRLEDFLHWILLLRAIEQKTPDRPWSAISRDIGVHAHTLGRYAKQLTGRTLPELSAAEAQSFHIFRERVLTLLLRTID
jgi:hypothetical protein